METVLQIDGENAAREWLACLRAVRFSKVTPAVRIALPFLTDAENRALTREAGKLRNACGCSQAGLAMTAALIAAIYRFATDGVPLAATSWSRFAIAALAIAAAASLAKLASLMFAHHRLIALAEQICISREVSKELATTGR